ncbi:hypothetical protein [Azorhizobium sp. AG788]|uniref:hypothetical protein n=1 Tax=Azorhizobium sp. AG788 TaxID=2183897 RepID=UPI003139A53B
MTQVQREGGGMRAPHRRDISARQDLLGKELRQLFDDYTHEDMPDELMKLAAQLQGAFEGGTPAATPDADASKPVADDAADTPPVPETR